MNPRERVTKASLIEAMKVVNETQTKLNTVTIILTELLDEYSHQSEGEGGE